MPGSTQGQSVQNSDVDKVLESSSILVGAWSQPVEDIDVQEMTDSSVGMQASTQIQPAQDVDVQETTDSSVGTQASTQIQPAQDVDVQETTDSSVGTQASTQSEPVQDVDVQETTDSSVGTQASTQSEPVQDVDVQETTDSSVRTQARIQSQSIRDVELNKATGSLISVSGSSYPEAYGGPMSKISARGEQIPELECFSLWKFIAPPPFTNMSRQKSPGTSGLMQSEAHEKHTTTISARCDDVISVPERFSPRMFIYIAKCTCTHEVPESLKSVLDELCPTCGHSEVEAILSEVYQFVNKLCPRHCQLLLVKVLGRDRLIHKTDTQSLRNEIAQLVPKLRYCFQNLTLQMNFTLYKKGYWFCWDLVDNAIVTDKGRGRTSSDRDTSDKGRRKRRRLDNTAMS
ncbi:hypothetical protein F4861DRAFT_536444 [Xylaria intraflava]|nr:hypothetical protein F4861DRAFT_536444 [Xylaria intraflava]